MSIPLFSAIAGIQEIVSPAASLPTISSSGSSAGGGAFAGMLRSAISQVEGAQQAANTAAANFLASGQGDVHTVALASQRAELSMEMFQQVRNKIVSAYQEIMKMPM
jgi:flagellar hook-basal body complex protein FliE